MQKKIVTGDTGLIKNLNLALALDLIKNKGPISRAQVARITGLSRSTCSQLVDQLIGARLVVETGTDASTGGRKPILLSVNYEAGRAIGVKLMQDRIIAALVDVAGESLASVEEPVDSFRDPPRYLRDLEGTIRNLLERSGRQKNGRKILGIGIGMSGLVDAERGVSIRSSILGWNNVAIKAPLEKAFRLPVHLENDVNTLAIGQKWLGLGREVDDFLCVTIGMGVGAGIIVGGNLYRGAHHGAGEFGHTKVSDAPDAPRCSCGCRGCVEAYASNPAIVAWVEQELARGRDSALRREAKVTHEKVVAHAASGDPLAQEAFRRAGRYLGLGISNLIDLLDPEMIIVGGEGTTAADHLFPEMERTIQASTAYELDRYVKLVPLRYEGNLWVRGAAMMAVRQAFSIPV